MRLWATPREGRRFLDRSKRKPGMIRKGDDTWDAFHDVGWKWGGTWNNIKDWQHFSATGK